MMLSPRFFISGTILISLLAFLYPAHLSYGQAREHDTRIAIHPCGNPNTDLTNITEFFEKRWQATYVDLQPMHIAAFVLHYELLRTDIVKIRIFQSTHQPKLGVVLARKFENHLNGKPLVSMYCVIKVNNQYVVGISPETLADVLKGTDEDT